jgi:hypothetical protein
VPVAKNKMPEIKIFVVFLLSLWTFLLFKKSNYRNNFFQIVLMTTVYYDGFWPTYYEVRFLDYLGTGLWCGGFFVISGAVGLLAGIKPTDGRLVQLN